MKLIRNTGNDRVVDELRRALAAGSSLDMATSSLTLHAYGEAADVLKGVTSCRLVVPNDLDFAANLLGGASERPFRNKLGTRWLAMQLKTWLETKAAIRMSATPLPQSFIGWKQGQEGRVITGQCPFTTDGLGLTPGDRASLIQYSETADESDSLFEWFDYLWTTLPDATGKNESLLSGLQTIADHKAPSLIYFLMLYHVFHDIQQQIDEDKVVRSATGIRDSVVWKKLFKFQRDGVIGAIDKLERFGGCIIADSVGLGKTFEALAVIKYYQLRNDRVLVLCPKRLRDNWTLYASNDRRNSLAGDRLNYDVLNHTDLSRDSGLSGDIDLANINWGNYDLVVIDESHNFRNKAAFRGRETRYDRLMNRIIKSGVKTRVLMLSATPVNNRLADLKNQIAFVTEGLDGAFAEHAIPSIEATTRLAQAQFNRWLKLGDDERKPARLIDMLGFDYFKLLDLLTIARSRKHVEKYYGVTETGKFPSRLRPINIKADVDKAGEFRSIRDINNEIRRLNLSAYAPLKYVLPHKQAAYEDKYATKLRGGERVFKQADREESLIHLLRVNILKRMESAVSSFALTIERQLADVNAILARIDSHDESVDELSIEDIEVDDSAFEALLVGRNVKVLLQDVDRIRWRQDLVEDRDRLGKLLTAAQRVEAARDDKLDRLKTLIEGKVRNPINPGNRKIIVFTAFADTAAYLYENLADWLRKTAGLNTALVTGAGRNRTNVPKLRTDLGSILTSFSPRSKERPEELVGEGEIDLLIATDCISEGQNLQDCDYLINYDIHWNPVRIIQRFGRIDRIGSPNTSIQLVNFWPNIELEEYINLEQRVSGRMVLLDISATGEENIIEQQSGDPMNDLEYRRQQLLKLQDTVIDLEDLSNGVSIADLTLNDFRIDLAGFLKEHPGVLDALPFGAFSVASAASGDQPSLAPGVVFCLRAAGDAALRVVEPDYPLSPHYLVHVGQDGTVLLSYSQAKQVLDHLKRVCLEATAVNQLACRQFDHETRNGQDMATLQKQLAAAVASITGKKEERAVASLFAPGGTHAQKGEFAGINDFEVVAYLVILPPADSKAAA